MPKTFFASERWELCLSHATVVRFVAIVVLHNQEMSECDDLLLIVADSHL